MPVSVLPTKDAKKSLFGRMNHELENHFINTIAHLVAYVIGYKLGKEDAKNHGNG